MVWWTMAAWAGFYHPQDVASESRMFASVSEGMAEQASEAQRETRALALALRDYEEALDLLGDAAPPEERARLQALERQYHRELAVLQAAVDEKVAGFDQAFGSALARALRGHPGAERCARQVAAGPAIPGLGARTERNPACRGDDLNARLAAVMDEDSTLFLELNQVTGPLPTFSLPVEAMPSGERWIGVAPFFQAAAGDALRAIRQADEEARLPIEAAIEQGATEEALRALRPEARAIDEQTADRRAELAAPVLERAAEVFTKRAPGSSWCAQPARLGGCTGTDATRSLAGMLRDDRKLLRTLP